MNTDQRETLGELLSSVDDLLNNSLESDWYLDRVREALTDYRKVSS